MLEAASMGMRSSKSDMPQGTLDMVILQVVAAGPIHGYALAQRIRLISRDLLQIQQGSLYPALHRLENRGFLAAEWNESETGRDAKFYCLTPKLGAEHHPGAAVLLEDRRLARPPRAAPDLGLAADGRLRAHVPVVARVAPGDLRVLRDLALAVVAAAAGRPGT